jgi:hypothetical protein
MDVDEEHGGEDSAFAGSSKAECRESNTMDVDEEHGGKDNASTGSSKVECQEDWTNRPVATLYESLYEGSWTVLCDIPATTRTLTVQRRHQRQEASLTDKICLSVLEGPENVSLDKLRVQIQENGRELFRRSQSAACPLSFDDFRRMRPNVQSKYLRKMDDLPQGEPPAWLLVDDDEAAYSNDEIINRFMQLLGERGRELPSQPAFPVCYYMNSHVMGKLVNPYKETEYLKEKPSTKNWKGGIWDRGFWTMDYVFFPINVTRHWILAVVAVREREVRLYDSLGGRNIARGRAVLRYLKEKVPDLDLNLWETVVCGCPQQPNWCDCGPFICFFAYFLSIGLPIPLSAITMKQAIRWRETMATYLMESEIPVHSSLWP